MKVVLVTGGFDPLHSGHLAYFKSAKLLGTKLVVGVNSDEWLTRKKGKPFMPFQERIEIIKGLSVVDDVISFDDTDDTACGAIYKTLATHASGTKIIFANGGDRTDSNIPEMTTYGDLPYCDFVFGVGGEDKKNSSSWILGEWKAPKVERNWGHYRELYQGEGFHVKELVIYPHSKLSMQRHNHRSETWNIVSGKAYLKTKVTGDPFDGCNVRHLHRANPIEIPTKIWHQGCNDSDEPAHIVEIWKGDSDKLSESDIERWDRE
mgnify:CR=1 FL=1|tara:strand:- start:9080 stop:9868 length:789 start_codon:yes stop_codon:yes gene_type:complete